MAYGRKRKYTFRRKRRNYRRRRSWKKKGIVSKGRYDTNRNFTLNAFPNSYTARLRYVEQISMNPGIAATTNYVFRANDCFDPNMTGTGHRPKGFDEMMNQYDHFTVVGSKITMKYHPDSTSDGTPMHFGIYLSDDGVSVPLHTNVNDLLESRTTGKYATAGIIDSDQRRSVTKTFSAKKFFRKQALIGDSLYRGTSAASPTEQAYFECWAASVFGNDPSAASFIVTIDYLVVFTERKILFGSY